MKILRDFFIWFEKLEKRKKETILSRMSDYIINSKNRKLKKQITRFFSRIGFWAWWLPFSGRFILLMTGALIVSLFFPWIEFGYSDNTQESFGAFSRFTGYIGYGIFIWASIIIFFLLSHTKKERIRAYVPFRLSDTQAIVFVASILFISFIQFLIISTNYHQIALQGVHIRGGFILATTSIIFIILAGFFLSRKSKLTNTELYYLNHQSSDTLGEYKEILHPKEWGPNKGDKNMSLPI